MHSKLVLLKGIICRRTIWPSDVNWWVTRDAEGLLVRWSSRCLLRPHKLLSRSLVVWGFCVYLVGFLVWFCLFFVTCVFFKLVSIHPNVDDIDGPLWGFSWKFLNSGNNPWQWQCSKSLLDPQYQLLISRCFSWKMWSAVFCFSWSWAVHPVICGVLCPPYKNWRLTLPSEKGH